MRSAATIFVLNSDVIVAGLQPASRCDEAIRAAEQIAREEGREVILADSDGNWLVWPDGQLDEMDDSDWIERGLTPPEDD